MARHPKPWFRKGRGWYVTLGGQQIKLGNDKETALSEYHKLMLEDRPQKKPVRADHVRPGHLHLRHPGAV